MGVMRPSGRRTTAPPRWASVVGMHIPMTNTRFALYFPR